VAVGHVARLVAERTGAVGDDTFTLGLLHEVGVVAGLITLSTQALWPEGLPKGDHIPLVIDQRGSLTDKLVRAWCLPDSIARGLSDLGRGSPPTDAGLASVIVANRLAELIGFAGANEAVHAAESEARLSGQPERCSQQVIQHPSHDSVNPPCSIPTAYETNAHIAPCPRCHDSGGHRCRLPPVGRQQQS
jgi:hypothetical protein